MKRRKIALIILTLAILTALILAVTVPAMAASSVTNDSWISSPREEALVKCPGGECDHKACDYVYSFAVIGDTQNLNIIDAADTGNEYMKDLYQWIADREDDYNIKYVLGLGDITQAYYSQYNDTKYGLGKNAITAEWANAKEAIAVLDNAGLPYSLVRGNHDVSSYFNANFGKGTTYYNELAKLVADTTTDEKGRPMAGFFDPDKIEDTYRKVIIGGHKYIIFTLDWMPSDIDDCTAGCVGTCEHSCLEWVDRILGENEDYKAIITVHDFIYRDSTITDDFEDTFPHENMSGERPNWEEVSSTGGNGTPKELWGVLRKHENVELILCGHIDEDDIKITQLRGDKGNTVTAMLIDGQTIDSTVEPVGLVAMFYVSADGRVINVDYVSTVRALDGKPAYLGAQNQFELTLDYTVSDTDDGWTQTPHGDIPTHVYSAHPFHVLLDDDSDESTNAFLFGSYDSWEQTLKAIHDFSGNGYPASVKKQKTYYIVMAEDYTDDYSYINDKGQVSGIHDNRAAYNFTKTVLDLNGNTLTLASKTSGSVFLPFYTSSAGKSPNYTITNGSINITGDVYLAVTQSTKSGNGVTGTLEFSDLDITYAPSSNATPRSLVAYYGGSGTGAYVNLNVDNCNIDFSNIDGAFTLFNLKDTNNNNHVSVTMRGGSIKGNATADATIFSRHELNDKVTFAKDSDGNYTTAVFNDSGSVPGVFYTDVKDTYYEFGAGVANGSVYEYKLGASEVTLTEYGQIPAENKSAQDYPFVLFKNGKVILAASDWNALINTNIKNTANYQSGCTLLLRRDYSTSEASGSPSWFLRIDDLAIDLGGHVFTRGAYHLFQIFGTEADAHETKLLIKNGTLKTVSAFSPIVFNNADSNTATDKIEIVLNDVTFDIEGATGGTRGPIVAFGDGVEKGVDANITLNDCTIYRGSSTNTATLFSLIDEKTGKANNKTDVTVTVNGGTVVADSLANLKLAEYSPAREGMLSSADKVYLGEGSDGKLLTFKLPASYKVPSTLYELTDGNHALGLVSEDEGFKYYTLDPTGTVFGDVSAEYVSVESYPFALFYNGVFKCGYAAFNSAVSAAVGYIDTAAEAQACGTVQIAMRRDVVCTGAPSFHTARGEIVIDLQGYELSCDKTYLVSTYIDYGTLHADGVTLPSKHLYASNVLGFDSVITFQNGDIRNNRTDFGMIGIDTKNSHSVEGYGRKSFVFNFDNVSFSTVSKPIVQAFGGKSGNGHDIEINVKNSTLDFTGAAAGATMFLCGMSDSVFTFDIDFKNCSVIASKLDSYNMYTASADDTVTVSSIDGGTYLTVTQTTESIPTNSFTAADGKTLAFSSVSGSDGSYVYKLLSNDGGDLGVIPPSHSSSTDYPIVIFKADSTFVGGYKTWAEAAAAAGLMGAADSQVGGADCIILFRDNYTHADTDAQVVNVTDYQHNVTIDLGGNTVTSAAKCFITLTTATAESIGRLHIRNGDFVYTAGGTATSIIRLGGTAGVYQIDFTDIRINSKAANYVAISTASGSTNTVNSKFTDCVFDYTGSLTTGKGCYMFASGNNGTIDVTLIGCEIIAQNSDFALECTVKSGGPVNALTYYVTNPNDDKIKYGEGNVLTLSAGSAAPTAKTGKLEFAFEKTENGSDVYSIVEKHTYGSIPVNYTYSEDYPILVFKTGNIFVGGYTEYADAIAAAGLIGATGSQVDGADAVILFRDDYTQDTSGGNISDFYNNVTIDLGGRTVTSDTQNFLYLRSGASLKDASKGASFGEIRVINGKLILAGTSNNVSAVRTDGDRNPTVDVTYSVTFEDVEFAVSGTKVRFLVASTAAVTTGKSTLDIDCIGCTFDCTGAGSRAMYLFASGNARVIDATVIGGEIIGGANSSFAVTYYVSPLDDTLKFERDGNGERTLLSLGSSVAAPTAEYAGLVFVKKSDDGANTIYKLIPALALDLNFVPKTSITLDSSLYLNVYIPENEYLTGLTLDGIAYSLDSLTAENGYYRIAIRLDSSEAARDIPMVASFEANGETFTAKFTHSILKYASKLLASNDAIAEEKTLVCDMLAYVKSAYTYFDSADAESVAAAIDAIMSGYTPSAFEAVSGETDLTVPESVTFILDATPRIRFSFAEGTNIGAYTFRIGNTAVPYTQTTRTDGDVTYVCAEISLFAYKMIKTVELYEGETKLGGFHINSYYEFAKGQNDEKLADVVERFYIYCKSANAYRDAVIAGGNA